MLITHGSLQLFRERLSEKSVNVHATIPKGSLGHNYYSFISIQDRRCREVSGKLGVVNTTGTDENVFRLVPVLGHGARVLPLEQGAQISAQSGTNKRLCSDWCPMPGHQSEQGLCLVVIVT